MPEHDADRGCIMAVPGEPRDGTCVALVESSGRLLYERLVGRCVEWILMTLSRPSPTPLCSLGREYRVREQQIKRERVAWAAMVGRSGEDTLVARARRATTDTRPTCPCKRAGHRSRNPPSDLIKSYRDLTSLRNRISSPLRTNRAALKHTNRSHNGRSLEPSHYPHKLLNFPIVLSVTFRPSCHRQRAFHQC